jgi:hypothetical protein
MIRLHGRPSYIDFVDEVSVLVTVKISPSTTQSSTLSIYAISDREGRHASFMYVGDHILLFNGLSYFPEHLDDSQSKVSTRRNAVLHLICLCHEW